MTPEGRVKEAVKKYLRSKGVWYFMPMQNGFGVVGIPDFICCFAGRFFAIETKAPGKVGNTTKNQERIISEIRTHGGHAIVADDVEVVARFFESLGVNDDKSSDQSEAGVRQGVQRQT